MVLSPLDINVQGTSALLAMNGWLIDLTAKLSHADELRLVLPISVA